MSWKRGSSAFPAAKPRLLPTHCLQSVSLGPAVLWSEWAFSICVAEA